MDPITRVLAETHGRFAGEHGGEVATYIPELATANPDHFGIALATAGGRVYGAGDLDVPFTIQSVSKPFVFALALSDLGLEATLERVGAEPSGEAFNAISLEPGTGRPANPMINAGAIVTTSLVAAPSEHTRFERIRTTLSAFAGRELAVDEAVYRSELETGHMNRALAYLMLNAGSLRADVEETLRVYFRQCSVLVTARDLATMAATLANGGLNPVTGARVIDPAIASHVLTVMGTCGMYNGSGEWLLRVGLPAKSGVGGGLIAVKPGQFGLGLFSPPVDALGNSVRAVQACRVLAERFHLHLMHGQESAPLPANGAGVEDGRVIVRAVQGDISFADAETILHELAPVFADAAGRTVVLDLTRAGRVHSAARALLSALAADLTAAGATVTAVDPLLRGLLPGVTELRSLDAAR